MSIKKKLTAGVLLGGLMLSASMSIGAANPPAGSSTWSGNVGYGDVLVDTEYKTNPDAVTFISFDSSPEYMKVWFTSKNLSDNVVSDKFLIPLGQGTYVSTRAKYKDYVRLYASREHWGDQAFQLSGKWKP